MLQLWLSAGAVLYAFGVYVMAWAIGRSEARDGKAWSMERRVAATSFWPVIVVMLPAVALWSYGKASVAREAERTSKRGRK